MKKIELFNPSAANGTFASVNIDAGNVAGTANRVYEARVVGSGAVAATVAFYGSINGTTFSTTPFGTVILSGTTSSTDSFASQAPWPYVQCIITGISGTGATVRALVAF